MMEMFAGMFGEGQTVTEDVILTPILKATLFTSDEGWVISLEKRNGETETSLLPEQMQNVLNVYAPMLDL